ncbi:Imm71 family immunity protein [Caballeronia sp. LjRoot31]|jgi:hypothetical protein|uniref:Imm71 family immunity protein n=1 Tax=Caballeronia sp. LjRoot31 TaxID=3342324 RepID=UPI003ECF83B0
MNELPQGAMLPSELERKQIFYWLKRISSYTAWNRILGYYRHWATVAERSVQVASERGCVNNTAITEDRLISILKGLAHCEEGARRLRLGDKRVFKYDANGEFVLADRTPSYWSSLLWRIEIGDTYVDKDRTPHWAEFEYAVNRLNEAWGECSPDIIEPQYLGEPSSTAYGVYLQEHLPKMTFPKVLPEVHAPAQPTLVATGKSVPCTGIWEPVEVPKPKGLYLFGAPPPEGPLPIIGCMAYLHGGSKAPQASLETADANPDADVTWRLLWQDNRYADGSLPEEEAGYVFQTPDRTSAAPEPDELRGGLRVPSDTPCPYPGVWECLDRPLGPQTVAYGVPMPRVGGECVMWRLMKAI